MTYFKKACSPEKCVPRKNQLPMLRDGGSSKNPGSFFVPIGTKTGSSRMTISLVRAVSQLHLLNLHKIPTPICTPSFTLSFFEGFSSFFLLSSCWLDCGSSFSKRAA